MQSDPLFNTVYRAKQRGCHPRRIGEETWEARCPVCRKEYSLVLEPGSLVSCRSAKKCRRERILEALRLPGKAAFNVTPPAVAAELSAMPIEHAVYGCEHGTLPKDGGGGQPAEQGATGPPGLLKGELPAETAAAQLETAGRAVARGVDRQPVENADVMTPTAESRPEVESKPLRLVTSDGDIREPVSEPAPHERPAAEAKPVEPIERRRELATVPMPVLDAIDPGTPYDVLTRLTAPLRTIRTDDGRHYVAVPVGERVECLSLESAEFRRLLLRLYHEATGDLPQQAAVANILGTLRGRAEIREHAEHVYQRVGRDEAETAYFLHLGDRKSRAVEIGAAGWQIVERPAIPFWRPPGQRPCPAPARGGSIELLRKFVNVADSQWPLLVVWLTAALRPVGPYPLLIVTGEQGSAKSTLAQVCRWLVDPHATPLRALPRSERDLMVAAHNNWLLAFDNVSALATWQSDAFCRLSTGAGFATRALYADDRELIISAQRPTILNGIDDFVRRSDLIDRSIFLPLPTISSSRRRTDRAFWREFHREHPRLLGALLDAVSGGLRCLPDVELPTLSRMADLDCWGEAVVRGLGWPSQTFASAYAANRKSACVQVLEDNPLGTALSRIIAAENEIRCTATDLLATLNRVKADIPSSSKDWPRSVRELATGLRRLAPQFRQLGVEVTFSRTTGGTRLITVRVA